MKLRPIPENLFINGRKTVDDWVLPDPCPLVVMIQVSETKPCSIDRLQNIEQQPEKTQESNYF